MLRINNKVNNIISQGGNVCIPTTGATVIDVIGRGVDVWGCDGVIKHLLHVCVADDLWLEFTRLEMCGLLDLIRSNLILNWRCCSLDLNVRRTVQ